MCGRFTLKAPPRKIAQQFQLDVLPDWQPRYNVAPTQQSLVVRAAEASVPAGTPLPREAVRLRWGLVPVWAEDAKIGNQLINARSESAATKPSFRHAFKKRRCLIPVDGFYEWKKVGSAKQPYYVTLKAGELMAFAGLWERWDKEGEPLETFTILTTAANEALKPLHDRMPVILAPEDYDRWLDVRVQSADELLPLMVPYPAEQITYWPVSREMNKPTYDKPACIEPITWEG